MLDAASVILTALAEHHKIQDLPTDTDAFVTQVTASLEDPANIPSYSPSSRPLSLVSFRCMLQDTGYPMEVYLPVDGNDTKSDDFDPSRLQERWVGWATEVPGQQAWVTRASTPPNVEELSLADPETHSSVVRRKYPQPHRRDSYLGALIKVYDETSYKPSSSHTFVGLLSSAPLPSPLSQGEQDDAAFVPALHVLATQPAEPLVPLDDIVAVRERLVAHLADLFEPPDQTAAELLLLSLLSTPSIRPAGLPPLGTLSLNLIRPSDSADSRLAYSLGSLVPALVTLSLSLDFLHAHDFFPKSSDSAGLDAGVLQLVDGTLLLVDETAMGEGGKLEERAVKNLRALSECVSEQRLRYEYPYMEDLKMDCALRVIVESEGKSLLPVDVHLPVSGASSNPTSPDDLGAFRSYIFSFSSASHASNMAIPDDVTEVIQENFVQSRQRSTPRGVEAAEAMLKRRMKIARLMALSFPDARLTKEIWNKTVALDEEATERMHRRQAAKREGPLGHPEAR